MMLFYIEDPERRDGGCLMCWWEVNDRGYLFDVERARVFTQREVEDKISVQMGDKIAWPKLYIDEVAKDGLVVFDDCDAEMSWKPV